MYVVFFCFAALLVFYVNDVVYIVCCAFCVFVLTCLFVAGNTRIRILVLFLLCVCSVCTIVLLLFLMCVFMRCLACLGCDVWLCYKFIYVCWVRISIFVC